MKNTRRLKRLIFPVCLAALMNLAVFGFASGETEAAAEPVTLDFAPAVESQRCIGGLL